MLSSCCSCNWDGNFLLNFQLLNYDILSEKFISDWYFSVFNFEQFCYYIVLKVPSILDASTFCKQSK